MTPTTPSSLPAFDDHAASLAAVRPIYCALVREFVVDVPACPFEEAVSESPESIKEAETWLQQVDAQIQVHQLRQFLQTTPLANEIVLRYLLVHHLHKPSKSTSDRDKTDFLLVQYFSLCAPSGMEDSDIDLDYVVAKVRVALELLVRPEYRPAAIRVTQEQLQQPARQLLGDLQDRDEIP